MTTNSQGAPVHQLHEPLDLSSLMAPDWAEAMSDQAPLLSHLGELLRAELRAGVPYLPAGENVLRAFSRPLADVRVLILGQDPYPTPGHAMGLSFSVPAEVRPLPPSLRNVFLELHDDVGCALPESGDLTAWADQGVLLLNRVLTVRPGASGSHRGWGWERFTEAAVRALVARGGPLVAILWGRDAATVKPWLEGTPTVESAHPSPLSARGGFFGSRPFTRANELLVAQGAAPIEWALP